MADLPPNLTLQRILDVAETQFSERGFVPVRLRDIAAAIGVKHTVLYYYIPGGKEQLYVDVMTRSMQRHRLGMEAAIAQAGPDLRRQMQAVAAWLLSQPPLNLARMEASDFPALRPEHAQALSSLIFDCLRLPLQAALERAHKDQLVDLPNPGLAAITFTSVVQSIHNVAATGSDSPVPAAAIVEQVIDMLLYGWLKR
jgi:AcrR family transcriptional regulator